MSSKSRELETWEREPFADAAPAIDDLRRRCAGCPPARVLSAAAADGLPAEEQAVVAAHVESCPTCLTLQADLDGLEPVLLEAAEIDRILGRVERGMAPGPRRAWAQWTSWVPASLAAVAAILAIVYVASDRAQTLAPLASGPAPAAETTALASPPAPPAVPGPDLQKPPVKLTMLALTWRNGGASGGGFAAAIAPALNAFRADRYDESERALRALSGPYPSSVEVLFYQGVSQLFLGRNQEAVTTLRRAKRLADDTFAADAEWYLGIALARTGHVAEAHARFAALCRGKSTFATGACEAAK